MKLPSLLLILLLATGLTAATEPARTHNITVADYPSVATMFGAMPSPDGKWIVYGDSRWDLPTDRRNSDLWIVAAAGKSSARRLTFDLASDRSPAWGPKGEWLYFASNRRLGTDARAPYNGKTQVWRVKPGGGTPVPVTRIAAGLSSFRLAPDLSAIFYCTHKGKKDKAWAALRGKYAGKVNVSPTTRMVSTIHRLDLNTWREEVVVSPNRYIRNFEIAPNGKYLAMITCPDERLITNEGWSRIDIFRLLKQKTFTIPEALYRKQAPSPYGWIEDMSWSPDSMLLAFRVGWDGYPDRLFATSFTQNTCTVCELKRPDDDANIAGNLAWRPGTHDLCFLAEWHGLQHVYCIPDISILEKAYGIPNIPVLQQGDFKVIASGNLQITSFGFLPENKLAVIACAPTHGRDLFVVAKDNKYHRLTNINPQMATWKLPTISLVNWIGADGDRVEGVLELPYGYDQKKDGPLPMIVELHGGPTSSTMIGMRFWCYGRTIMAANGYALFSPNYHGSTGYGDKFLTSLIGRENEIEVKDILTGVDHLVAKGIADPERLGVMGWSNGGFLTNAIITATTRFKAASSGAGVSSQLLQWALEDTPGHVINYMQGLPWEKQKAYLHGSPIANLGKCTTPTLIHCGAEDPRVPIEHSKALFRGLNDYLKVPSVLLSYPGQGHGLGTCTMRKAKMEWDLAWFAKYVLGKKTK